MKKVGILSSVHPALDVRIFHKEAKTLVKAGYKVTLIAEHKRNETVNNIKIIALQEPRNRFSRIFGTTWKIFKLALKQKADVYHFHDPELIPMGFLLKLFKKRVIYDVHEDYKSKILSKPYLPPSLRKIIALFFDIFEKQTSRNFDAIVTADNYVRLRFKHNNIYSIANFPIIINIRKAKRDNKEFICIYVGGLTKDRGILKIAEALQYLQNMSVKVILIGKWEDENIKKTALRLPVVEYLGYKPWEDTIKNLALADIGLNILQPVPAYLYAAENTVKIFEYMMLGLPVISSNFPGLKKIIEGNNCGICVDPTNTKEIASAIKYLYENFDVREKMGENGRKAVLEKYNWENESKKLLKIYEELIKQ